MKYVIDIPKSLIDKVRYILAKGEYDNLSDLIITALENQIILEEGEMIQEDLFSTVVKVPKVGLLETDSKKAKHDFFKWVTMENYDNIKTFPMPEITVLEYPNTTYNDNWLWGQVNRVFPVKVGLRILGNMQQKNSDYIPLRDFQEQAAELARGFGLQIQRIDAELKRKRNEKFSTALPIGRKEDKAIQRYISHFLATKRAGGILDGAMSRLKFVNIQKKNESPNMIGITEEGLQFMKLRNPLLDESLYSDKTLSEEEADFYIEHVIKNVPEELNPIYQILSIIHKGISSVSGIDIELKEIKNEWTDVMVATQRSGSLGRMIELGLLTKLKDGIKVAYTLTGKGKELINRVEDSNN